ncbi:cytochrome b [Fontimonas sp. SYSU GA230001]|uniref:cytochrome b n=1 Tax=Fontimonas sp. SYSU GA230001 TaxID=3142450 RepID=UPI0032B50493
MRNRVQPEVERYGAPAQLLHWLTALLVLGVFAVGFYMVGLNVSPLRLRLFSYHKWIGVTVFALALLRLAWRLVAPPPALPATMPAWERQAAAIGHRLLYLLVLAVPLSGWLMSSAKGFQTVYLGVLPIPDALAKNPPLGAALEAVHWGLNKMLLAMVCVHIAAALKHQFIDRDGVLLRMLPRRQRTGSA